MSVTEKYTVAEMTGELTKIAPAFIAVANEKNVDAGELLKNFVGKEATAEQVATAIQYAQLTR